MTLYQSDVLELLEAIRSGGDIDAIRKGAEFVYQALIEAEASEQIGATRYERSESRTVRGLDDVLRPGGQATHRRDHRRDQFRPDMRLLGLTTISKAGGHIYTTRRDVIWCLSC